MTSTTASSCVTYDAATHAPALTAGNGTYKLSAMKYTSVADCSNTGADFTITENTCEATGFYKAVCSDAGALTVVKYDDSSCTNHVEKYVFTTASTSMCLPHASSDSVIFTCTLAPPKD
jgi:hypothetical protein